MWRIGRSCVKFVAILTHYIHQGVFECVHGFFQFEIIVNMVNLCLSLACLALSTSYYLCYGSIRPF